MVLCGKFVRLVDGFRRCTDAELTVEWAEALNWHFLVKRKYSYEIVPEQEWMSPLIPEVAAPQPAEAE